MQVEPIPAFNDNYIWLVRGPGDGCAVVDPGDAGPVLKRLAAGNLKLTSILVTHKHGDHVGGLADLKQAFPDVQIFGPINEPIRLLDRQLSDGDHIELPDLGLAFDIMEVPGHTEGHIAYFGHGALFCGDTVFAGGCGRVFSGTFEQLSDSLERIARLPGDTRMYCAHEYTLDNLEFAGWVEPESEARRAREVRCRALRERDVPTVPSTLAEELETNPFLRVDQPEVIAAAERWAGRALDGRREVFRAVRTWKDTEFD